MVLKKKVGGGTVSPPRKRGESGRGGARGGGGIRGVFTNDLICTGSIRKKDLTEN